MDALSLFFVALKLIPGALTWSDRSAPSTLPKSAVIPDLCSLGRLCLEKVEPVLGGDAISAKPHVHLHPPPAASGGETAG